MRKLIVLALLVSGSVLAATTLTPSTVTLYTSSGKVISRGHADIAACVEAAKASGPGVYGCDQLRNRVTVTADAPVDCVVSTAVETAGPWSACSANVQTRTITSTRTIVTPAANGGAACPALVTTRTESQSCTVAPPPASGLVQQSNLVHLGSFRSPDSNGLENGGLTFSPAGTLYALQDGAGAIEFTIPAPVKASNWNSLPAPRVLQSSPDVTDGKYAQIDRTGNTATLSMGGLLVYQGKLVISGLRFYDAEYTTAASHFLKGSLDLSKRGETVGPVKITDAIRAPNTSARVQGRQMAHVPPEWVARMGGPVIVTGAGASIESAGPLSLGPNLTVFDPADIGAKTPVPGQYLLAYPWTSPRTLSLPTLMGYQHDRAQNPVWTPAARVGGVVWPVGTDSILFFGNTGVGPVFYGDYGGESGEHSHPYEYRVWAYDAKEILKVKAGTLQQHQVKPYGVWKLTFPLMPRNNDTRIDWLVSGVAYDPAGKIYVRRVGLYSDGDWRQVVDVFAIK